MSHGSGYKKTPNRGEGERKTPVEQLVVKESTMKYKTHYSTVFPVLQ